MKADLLLNQRVVIHENAFVEMVVWHVPESVCGSQHDYKYRLGYVVNGQCVLRFDNEAGKGDHYHRDNEEFVYCFISLDRLLKDFWRLVDEYTDD